MVRAFAHGAMGRRIDPSRVCVCVCVCVYMHICVCIYIYIGCFIILVLTRNCYLFCYLLYDVRNTFYDRGRAFAHGAVGRRIDPSWCTH